MCAIVLIVEPQPPHGSAADAHCDGLRADSLLLSRHRRCGRRRKVSASVVSSYDPSLTFSSLFSFPKDVSENIFSYSPLIVLILNYYFYCHGKVYFYVMLQSLTLSVCVCMRLSFCSVVSVWVSPSYSFFLSLLCLVQFLARSLSRSNGDGFSVAAEMLTRCGIGKLLLFDYDKVCGIAC